MPRRAGWVGCAKRKGSDLRNSPAASKMKVMISTARFAISKHTLSFIIDIGTANLLSRLPPSSLQIFASSISSYVFVRLSTLWRSQGSHTQRPYYCHLAYSSLFWFASFLLTCDGHVPCSVIALFSPELLIYRRYDLYLCIFVYCKNSAALDKEGIIKFML